MPATFLDKIAEIIGPRHTLTGDDAAPYLTDWRGQYTGKALAVVRPDNVTQVAQIMSLCSRNHVPVVAQGGNTGLCGGATPDHNGQALVLSLLRLNNIRGVDTDNDTISVDAGCTLSAVQQAANQANRLFPLSLGAEGSCTIGGNLATNAGGTQVLRYGNARDLALGLEAVMADGRILNGLHGLRKDNTGYNICQLLIGSEGTLGIITAATLKLFPLPRAQCTALLALPALPQSLSVLTLARQCLGTALTGFELISRNCLQHVVACYPQQRLPFGTDLAEPWYALLELSDSGSDEHLQERFQSVLSDAIEHGMITDAIIAKTLAESTALWHLRESIPLAEKSYGKNIKHDISIPISKIPAFIDTTNAALQRQLPGVEHIIFGHLGDGNLHYNVAAGSIHSEDYLIEKGELISKLVHDQVSKFDGSISAEHGIGQMKRDILARYQDPVELAIMYQIKHALDPQGLLNPGKIL